MKNSVRQLLLGAALAGCFALTFAALAQEKPAPTPTPEPAAPAATAPAAEKPAPAAEPAVAPAPESPKAAEPEKQPELRRLDSDTAPTPAPAKPKAPQNLRGNRRGNMPGVHFTNRGDNALVSVGHNSTLGAGEQADAVVSVFGSSTSAGDVADAVVSIMGDTRVTGGTVGDAAVAVLGNTYVNGKVGGDVVAVLGDIEFGPNAEVGGEVVSVGGTVKRDAGAVLHGRMQNVALGGSFGHLAGLQSWFRECLLKGRPLAFGPNLGWAWTLALAVFFLYFLIALLFGGGVDKCVNTLETRPGYSILTAILTILLIPVLIVLLCITVVGIAAVPFVAVGLLLTILFGKTVMLAWLGRRLTRFFGPGIFNHAAVAVLIGGVITLVLYTIPIVGIIVQKSFDLIGLGVAVYTLVLANKREKPATPPVPPTPPAPSFVPPAPASGVPPIPPAMPSTSPGFGAAGIVAGETPAASGAELPPVIPAAAAAPVAPPMMTPAFARPAISAATLPRAGFLIRLAALLLDFILIGIITSFFLHGGKYQLPIIAAYAAVMWQTKGTTIGGAVCGLKVVRLDDREIDWGTAIARALGCFLSLVVVGLGFIWVAIDDDKQSWHDKIAGTTVVRVPKGVSLI